MKKIYMLMIALFSAGAVFAQIPTTQDVNLIAPSLIPTTHGSSGISSNEHLRLENDTADAIGFFLASGQAHTLQWVMNKRFTYPANPNSYQYVIVTYDSLFDVNTETGFDNGMVNSITFDSIYFVMGHQN